MAALFVAVIGIGIAFKRAKNLMLERIAFLTRDVVASREVQTVAGKNHMALASGVEELRKRIEETGTLVLELKEQLEDLDPQAGIDAASLEKAFNEGIERIMNYSLTTAMGGGKNG